MKPAAMLLLALLLSCAGSRVRASFRGAPNPVLLGPRDRVGANGASAATPTAQFESAAWYDYRFYSPPGKDVTETRWTSSQKMASEAATATRGDPSLDIRLDFIRASGFEVSWGAWQNVEVSVQGSVTRGP
jgi:hypothetical protein